MDITRLIGEYQDRLNEALTSVTKCYLMLNYSYNLGEDRNILIKEFQKRYQNLYKIINEIDKEIDNLSIEDIDELKEEASSFWKIQIESHKYDRDKHNYNYFSKKYEDAISSSPEEIKKQLKESLNIEFFKSSTQFLSSTISYIDKETENTEIDNQFELFSKDEQIKKRFYLSNKDEYGPQTKLYSNLGHVKPIDIPKYTSEQSQRTMYLISFLTKFYLENYKLSDKNDKDIDFDNITNKQELLDFISDNNLVLYSRRWANNPDPVIGKLYAEIEKAFTNMIESYLLVEYGENFYETKDFPKEKLEEEFQKRFNNFYATLEKVKKEIKNLSKEKIDIIREKTTEFDDWCIEHYKYHDNTDVMELNRKRWNNQKEKMETASDNEMKNLLYLKMPFEWIKKYYPYPIDGVIDENSNIEKIDDNVEELYANLCRNERFKESVKNSAKTDHTKSILFEYYDASDQISMNIGQNYNGDLYPGLPMCIELFKKIEEKKKEHETKFGL